MSDDWPDDVPLDEHAEAEATTEVIAWTPEGQPRQSLPRRLPRPRFVAVTDQTLCIDGWVILLRREPPWVQWLAQSVSEWCQAPCDTETRRQLLGIIDAVEDAFRRSPDIKRSNPRTSDAI